MKALLWLLAFGALAQTRPSPPALWVIGEGFRVDPVSGAAREEMRIDGNPIPREFDYTHRNLAWDAARRRVTLSAARNEFVAYQLQIRGPAEGVSVTHSAMKGPAVLRDIEVFKQWYIDVRTNSSNQDSTTAGYNLGKGWYPDALVPAAGTFDIPDKTNAVQGQQWQGVWIDIYVPRDAPPGEYAGTITVSGKGIGSHKLPVSLKVYPPVLSDDFAMEVALNNYGSIGRKGSEMRLRYYQMARRHRMAVHEHYIAPKMQDGRIDWSGYDAEMGKYFTGEAFTAKNGYRGPGEGKPLRWAYLPFEILHGHAWPLPAGKQHTPEYDAAVRSALREFVNHFDAKGWDRTKLMFFINGLDEPTKAEAIDAIRYFGDLAKSAAAPRVYYRTDINHLHDIGSVIPGWTEERMFGRLSPVVDLWVAVADFKRTDFDVLLTHKARDPRQVGWFYQNREPSVGGYTLDDETIGLATWPVIAWKYGLDGCVLWECCFAGPSTDVWTDPNNTVDRGKGLVHNLAAMVMYPARAGVAEPAAGIRLKSFRRGAQDAEYLRLLERSAGRDSAAKLLDTVLGDCLHKPGRPYGAAGNWSHNPEDWNRMRLHVLESIR